MLLEHPGNDARNVGEGKLSVEKRSHGDLVGGIQHRRRGPPCFGGRAGEHEAGESIQVRRLEIEARRTYDVERFYTRGEPLRPAERMRDRYPHIGIAQLREHRTVKKFDE